MAYDGLRSGAFAKAVLSASPNAADWEVHPNALPGGRPGALSPAEAASRLLLDIAGSTLNGSTMQAS